MTKKLEIYLAFIFKYEILDNLPVGIRAAIINDNTFYFSTISLIHNRCQTGCYVILYLINRNYNRNYEIIYSSPS